MLWKGVEQNQNTGQDTVVGWSTGFIYGGATQGTRGLPSGTAEHQGTESGNSGRGVTLQEIEAALEDHRTPTHDEEAEQAPRH